MTVGIWNGAKWFGMNIRYIHADVIRHSNLVSAPSAINLIADTDSEESIENTATRAQLEYAQIGLEEKLVLEQRGEDERVSTTFGNDGNIDVLTMIPMEPRGGNAYGQERAAI